MGIRYNFVAAKNDLQRMKIMGPFILKIVTLSAATASVSDLRIKILGT